MAYALSADAQEFVPGSGAPLTSLDPTPLPSLPTTTTSLSVDAPVFVPTVETKEDEKSSTIPAEKKEKQSVVKRRGRFIHADNRHTRVNRKHPDNSDGGNKSTASKKVTNNQGGGLNSPSTSDDSRNLFYYSKEGSDSKKVKQSFSLEYSRKQKRTSSTEVQKNANRDAGFETNKDIQQSSCNSGESKPIVLWSSIVKQDAKDSKVENTDDINITQKENNKNDCEKTKNTKKNKNKVTRKKNVQLGKFNEKEYSKEMMDKDVAIETTNKTYTELTDISYSNITATHKPLSVSKNSRGKINDRGGRSGTQKDLKEICISNVDYDSNVDIANSNSEKIDNLTLDTKQNHRTCENEGKVKSKTTKKLNCLEEDLCKENIIPNKGIKSNQILKKTPSEYPVRPTECETEDAVGGVSVTLCDEASFPVVNSMNLRDEDSFPALAEGTVHKVIPVLSYSAITKRIPVNANPTSTREKIYQQRTVDEVELSETERISLKKKQKVLKRKMKAKEKKREAKLNKPETAQLLPEKLSEKGMTFDLSDIFTKLQFLKTPVQKSEKSTKGKKIKMSTGVISVVSGLAKKNTNDGRRMERNKSGATLTIMDGTTPIRKRGKERETPKKKKPTLLKKVITAERERKRALLEKNNLPTAAAAAAATEDTEEITSYEENIDKEKQSSVRVQYMSEFPEDILKKIHSKKFREYCDHVLTKEINHSTYNLLVTLQKFQDRVYHENPTKYKQKRRFILGLREVLKHLKLKRLKAVIIAPNLERISAKGGLDDYLGSIITICNELGIPKIYAMNRHVLGRVIKKLAPVSVVGIFDYSGAQDVFKELMENVQSAKDAYQEKVRCLRGNDCKNNKTIITSAENSGGNNCKKETIILSASAEIFVNSTIHNNEQVVENCKEHLKQQVGENSKEHLKQRMLNRLQLDEYWSCDVEEGESDAWVTDTEGAT